MIDHDDGVKGKTRSFQTCFRTGP